MEKVSYRKNPGIPAPGQEYFLWGWLPRWFCCLSVGMQKIETDKPQTSQHIIISIPPYIEHLYTDIDMEIKTYRGMKL